MNNQPAVSRLEQTPSLVRVASDELLLLGARLHDDIALGVLYDRYGVEVYGMALEMLHQPEPAEAVMQDVFLRIWRGLELYDAARGSTHDWLMGVTRRRTNDAINALNVLGEQETVVTSLDAAARRHDLSLLTPRPPTPGARERLLARARAESSGLRAAESPSVLIPEAELDIVGMDDVEETEASGAPTLTDLPILGPAVVESQITERAMTDSFVAESTTAESDVAPQPDASPTESHPEASAPRATERPAPRRHDPRRDTSWLFGPPVDAPLPFGRGVADTEAAESAIAGTEAAAGQPDRPTAFAPGHTETPGELALDEPATVDLAPPGPASRDEADQPAASYREAVDDVTSSDAASMAAAADVDEARPTAEVEAESSELMTVEIPALTTESPTGRAEAPGAERPSAEANVLAGDPPTVTAEAIAAESLTVQADVLASERPTAEAEALASDPPTVEIEALVVEPAMVESERATVEAVAVPDEQVTMVGSAVEPVVDDSEAETVTLPPQPGPRAVAPEPASPPAEVPMSEALAAALAPIPGRRPTRQQPPNQIVAATATPRRWRVKLISIFWAAALLFVITLGLLVATWSATGPHVSPDVAVFSRLPGGRVVTMRGMGAPNAIARLHVVENGRRAELAVEGMPVLPGGRVYQLWLAEAGQPIRNAGAFLVNRRGDAVISLGGAIAIDRLESILLTQEPAPGTTAPSGPRFLQWAP